MKSTPQRRQMARAFASDNPRPADLTQRETRFAMIKLILTGQVAYDRKAKKNKLRLLHS
jgi:hypothetical protein